MKHFLLALNVTLSLGCLIFASEDVPPAIAVSIAGGNMRTDEVLYPRTIMAAWLDGKIIWSDNQTMGGPPFLEARIDPAKIQELLTRFEKASVFEKDSFRHSWFGPDSTYHSISLSSGTKHTRIETWHELFEANPKCVVINGSVSILGRRKREDVINSDTKEFQAFRKLWTDLRTSTARLIPSDGTPVTVPLKLNLPE